MEKQKLKFSDWWYYHKLYVLGAAFVLVAIIITICMNMGKVETDIHIDCASDNCLTVEQARLVGEKLNESGAIIDVDGDGIGRCEINTYQTGLNGKNDARNTEATQLKLFVGKAAVFLTDENVINGYKDKKIFKDISHLSKDYPDRPVIKDDEGKVIAICIDECELFKQNSIATKGMYLTLRNIPGDLKKDKKLVKMFENADEVAAYIIK